jgi:hypothetical protein
MELISVDVLYITGVNSFAIERRELQRGKERGQNLRQNHLPAHVVLSGLNLRRQDDPKSRAMAGDAVDADCAYLLQSCLSLFPSEFRAVPVYSPIN